MSEQHKDTIEENDLQADTADKAATDELAQEKDATSLGLDDEQPLRQGQDTTDDDEEFADTQADLATDDDEEFADTPPDENQKGFQLASHGEAPCEVLSLRSKVEAVVFASPKCIKPQEILELIDERDEQGELTLAVETIEGALSELVQEYRERSGGFSLEHIKGHGYQFRSAPAAGPLMERMFASRPRPISRAALESLAIIAYRQPVTRADIEFIRGVDSGSIVKNLLERDLIKCVGRKEDAGRPMLFGTTDEFLNVFRLASLKDLPPLSAFQPNQETMREALKQFQGEDGQDDEPQGQAQGDFVGDDDEQEPPKISQGLIDSEEDELEVLEDSGEIMVDGHSQDAADDADGAQTPNDEPQLTGAEGGDPQSAFDAQAEQGADHDERTNQTKQVAVSDGDYFPEDGRGVDNPGPHRD